MFYEKELNFLLDTFKKYHLKAKTAAITDTVGAVLDGDISAVFGEQPDDSMTVSRLFGPIEPQTVYKYTDRFKLHYIYFMLPEQGNTSILVTGPFLPAPLSERRIFELGEENGIMPKNMRYLAEYYSSIPIVGSDSQLYLMLYTFCEIIWKSPSFRIIDTGLEHSIPASPIHESSHSENFDDIMVNMKTMEMRYAFENELMQAVTLGQIHKEAQIMSLFSDQPFEKRVADPLRNIKNYCIITNTLLRKAAERGGVHPVYIDKVSSSFATKIEQLPSVSNTVELMSEMFRSYCRLVRRHALKNYSLIVQKTILLIDSDLAADLSLSTLAESQSVSPGYLSTIFRRETGKTVSGYIRDKRIKHAMHLLGTTKLQIQTVALHCGIMDMQYFSKIFKKHTGKTPKEYREQAKQAT